jgi:hypothetical protein
VIIIYNNVYKRLCMYLAIGNMTSRSPIPHFGFVIPQYCYTYANKHGGTFRNVDITTQDI